LVDVAGPAAVSAASALIAQRVGASSLVALQAADDEVGDEVGVLGDRFGSRGSVGSKWRASGASVKGAAPPWASRKWKARSEMGRVRPQSARRSSRRSIGASAGSM
jgi:hypothetical protein